MLGTLTEKNWFFRLSGYQQRLLDYYEANPDFVQPDYRRNEMLGFIRQGLEDFSISRAGATWGIPFPIGEDGETAQREARGQRRGRAHAHAEHLPAVRLEQHVLHAEGHRAEADRHQAPHGHAVRRLVAISAKNGVSWIF